MTTKVNYRERPHDEILAEFEANVWRLLARYQLSSPVQSVLVPDLVKLADQLIVSRWTRTQASRIHFFPVRPKLGPSNMSRCGKAARTRTPASQITDNPAEATCGLCVRFLEMDLR